MFAVVTHGPKDTANLLSDSISSHRLVLSHRGGGEVTTKAADSVLSFIDWVEP